MILGHEEAFSRNHRDLPVHIYTSIGSLEAESDIRNWREMIDILQSRNYNGLKMTSDLFDEETHVSVVPVHLTRGMRAIFPPG